MKLLPEASPPEPGWRAWVGVAIPPLALAAYANSFSNGFVLDDETGIVSNGAIQDFEHWAGLLTRPRAITDLTFAANYAVGRLDAWGYHLVNLVIHVLAAMTLFGLIRRTLLLPRLRRTFAHASPWIALTVALIWLVHPLQTQSVTYIIQRAEALMGLFYLLTLYCVLRGARSLTSWPWYIAAIFACAMGMGSKAVMVTAPIAVLLFDRTFLTDSLKHALSRRAGLYLGLAASWVILLVNGVITGLVAPNDPTPTVGFAGTSTTPAVYLMTQTGVILHYIKLALWPRDLVLDYAWTPIRDPANAVWPIVIVAAVVLWTLWALFRRQSLGWVAAFFFLVLLPTSSFIPLQDPILEHRMYLSLASIVLFGVVGCYLILRDLTQQKSYSPTRLAVGTLLTATAVAALAGRTSARNRDYRNAETMWADVLAKRPHNARAHLGLGVAAFNRGDNESAERHLQNALSIDRHYGDAWYNLGNVLLQFERFDDAADAFRQSIEYGVPTAGKYYNLGLALKKGRRIEEAISAYSRAIWQAPDDPKAYLNIGNAYLEIGFFNEAVAYYDDALDLRPDYVLALVNKAAALMEQARYDEAVLLYERALEIDPDRDSACASRDFALSLMSDGSEPDADG